MILLSKSVNVKASSTKQFVDVKVKVNQSGAVALHSSGTRVIMYGKHFKREFQGSNKLSPNMKDKSNKNICVSVCLYY